MSNNSMVCADGGEIGRAQVAQAEACGLAPITDMNPILLKSTGALGSQVVLNGRPWKNLKAGEYYEHFDFLLQHVLDAFARLAADRDYVVIEGAGSLTELNLKHRDLVNLGLAQRLNAPSILVADIDRGGVFASIVGTFALFDQEEKDCVRGFIINRFRGDPRLFSDGPAFLEKQTARPCLGVLPYIESLRIDQEDSVSLEDHRVVPGSFRVGVIRLPHMSNYTDFNPLQGIAGVMLEYLVEVETAFVPDLLIIPGTKNTIADLRWLVARGFAKLLLQTLERGGCILGICGGYQMLGRRVSDPYGVEEGGTSAGLDLLPVETQLEAEKVTVQSKGRSFLGPSVMGYEIHMGRTESARAVDPFIIKEDGTADGAVSGRVAGTYFHGLFENHEFTTKFLTMVAESRRLEWRPAAVGYSKEHEYNRLADVAREYLNLERIYEFIKPPAA